MAEITVLERIAGAMLGLACGDALGAPAEYRSREFVREKWGRLVDMTGGGIWVPGEWTDDTGMTLCMAEGILERPEDPVEPVGSRFLKWEKTAKDVGDTVASVLDSYAGDWAKASRMSPAARRGRASGNGSLMRALPVALGYPKTWDMLTASAKLSALTHWDPQAETACAVYCLWIDGIVDGRSLRDAWASAVEAGRKVASAGPLDPQTPGPSPLPGDFWERLDGVEQLSYDDLQPSGYAGYVVECLEAAVWCCLNADDVEEAIVLAVNLGGDSDTIGAVAGGAAGAHWGVAALPTRWTVYLPERDRITEVARGLDELRRHHAVYATPGLPPFDYYRVAENLHAGRSPLTARDVRMLAGMGVTHFVDLRDEDEWCSADRLGAEAVEMMETLGLRRVSYPVGAESETFDKVHAFLVSTMANPEAHAYVHGTSGRRRTASVLAAYLAAESMMTYDEVVEHLSDQLLKSSGTRIEPDAALGEQARAWLRRRDALRDRL